MAKGTIAGGEITYTAQLDITEVLKNAGKAKKEITELEAWMVSASASSQSNYSKAQLTFQLILRKSRLELAELKKLEQEMASQSMASGTATEEHTKKLTANRLAQQELTKATREARKASQEVADSYADAKKKLTALDREIRNTAGGLESQSPELKAKIKERNGLSTKMKKFDAGMSGAPEESMVSSVVHGLGSVATGYLKGAAIFVAQTAFKANVEISDSLADLRIASGLTANEADSLMDRLKNLDTRTSLKGLLEISTLGGQLGIAKDQLSGFTEVIDQLSVSLDGKVQGGAEGIAKTLGSIDSAFGITKANGGDVEKSFNQIGSAIIGLTESGGATGGFLTDFAQKVGGIATQAGLSLPVVLSYGAVLEKSGMGAEEASSSFGQLLSSLKSDKDKFFSVAKIADANLTLKDFTNLVDTDAKEALDLFFTGLANGGTSTTSFDDILKSLQLTGTDLSQVFSSLTNSQVELGGSINNTTKNFGDATLSIEKCRLQNDTLAGSVKKLENAFDNALTNPNSGIGKFFKYIVDALTDAINDFEKLITHANLFYYSLSKVIGLVRDYTSTETVNGVSMRPSQAKKSREVLQDYQDNVNAGANLKATKIANASPNEASLLNDIRIEENKYQAFLNTYNYAKAFAKNIKNNSEEIEPFVRKMKEMGPIIFKQKALVEALGKTYSKLYPKPPKGELPSSEKNNNGLGTGNKKKGVEEVDERRSIQAEIDELVKKNKLKAKSATQQELAQVDEKYKALLDKAKKFNEEVDKFNKNPKNKNKRERVDITALEDTIIDEKAAVEDKQKATDLKKTIDEQKRLYDEFEDYKNKVGVENAKALYKDKINTDITYLDKLKDLEKGVSGTEIKKGVKTDQQEKVVKDSLQAEKGDRDKKQRDAFANAYKAAETHVQKLAALEEDYNDKKAALGDQATADQLANLDREYKEKVRMQNQANGVAKSGYAELMANYDQLTRGEIQKRLEAINAGYDKEYELGLITAEQLANLKAPVTGQMDKLAGDNSFNKIGGLIKNWKDEVGKFGEGSQGAEKAFKKLAGGIGAVAGDVNQVLGSVAGGLGELGIGGEGLQEVFKNVSGIVDGIGGIAKGISSGNPVEVITGSIKLLTSVMNIFNTKDKKLEKQIKNYKEQLVSLGDSYKKLERDVANSVGESIYTDQASQIENLKQQQILLTQARDAERNKKKFDQAKIDEFQSQIDSIPNQIEDIEKAVAQNLIRTTFKELSNSLADAFTEAFTAGEDAAGRFDDVFEKVIANAIKNSLKLKLLDPIVKNFTDDLAKYAQENGNSVVGFDFDSYKAKLKAAGDLFTAGLKESEDFFKGTSTTTSTNTNTLSGSIKAEMSEATGTLVAGAMNGMRIAQIETNALLNASNRTLGDLYLIARDKFTVQVKIEANTFRTAVNTDRLENIEYALMSMDKKMNLNMDALKASGRLS